jgi:phage head maturation protease
MSFAFAAKRDGTGDVWEKPGHDGIAQRTVTDADLWEISPVSEPAYPATTVGVRSIDVPDFDTESDSQAADEIQAQHHGRAAWRERDIELLTLGA